MISIASSHPCSKSSYVDVHCHLVDSQFDKDLSEVIERAQQANIASCVVVTEYFKDFDRLLQLHKKYPGFISPCFGIHPVQLDSVGMERSATLEDLEPALEYLNKYKDIMVGIGEVGLDFTPRYIKSPNDKEVQTEVFIKQIILAKQFDLPVNVHSRSAGRQAIAVLKEQNVSKAVLHAFSGKASTALEGVRLGYFFSIPPCIVLSDQKQKLLKQLPIENLLLETDSPALGPEPKVRNEPANIHISCEFIANLKKISPEEVRQRTTENAIQLFPSLKHQLTL